MNRTVAVIGGGAAGLMACGVLSKRVGQVILIEKNKFLGRKLRITGKGRCNITNSADVEDIIKNVDIELECFIHGAMCASYSGRCV